MVLTACLVLQTGGLHRSAGEHGVLQGGNEGEQARAGGWGRSTRGGRRKICNKVTVERKGPRNFWKLSPRAWACSNLSWSTRGVFCAWTWYITITFNIRVFIFTIIFVYWSELTNIFLVQQETPEEMSPDNLSCLQPGSLWSSHLCDAWRTAKWCV